MPDEGEFASRRSITDAAVSAKATDLPDATGVQSVYGSRFSPLREAFLESGDTSSDRIEAPVRSSVSLSVVHYPEYGACGIA